MFEGDGVELACNRHNVGWGKRLMWSDRQPQTCPGVAEAAQSAALQALALRR